jgi:hypothetical protein
VIDGADINGCLIIEANNVTIRNSRITCRGAYGIRSFNGNTNLYVVDTTLSCGGTSGTGIAAVGIFRRTNVSGCENGFSIWADTLVEDSWIHDLALVGGGHVDGIQINEGSRGITVRHSTIRNDFGQTSAIIGDTGSQINITVERNLLIGGGYTLYCAINPVNYQVRDNRFVAGYYGAWVYCDRAQVHTGNVRDSDGSQLPF